MHHTWTLALIIVAMAAGSSSGVAQHPGTAADSTSSVLDGVFTASQAERGLATFRQQCGACHSPAEFGIPSFLRAWRGQSVHALYRQISDRMPFDNPGSLEPQEYTDVIVYIFTLHALPAGDAELSPDPDVQKRIIIDVSGKDE